MFTLENSALIAQIATAVIAGFGLYGLWRYVIHTRKIAEATKLQGDVLSRPTISLKISKYRKIHMQQAYSIIVVHVANLSGVHAKVKIHMKAMLKLHGSDKVVDFSAPKPYDGTVLAFAAKEEIDDEVTFEGLRKHRLNANDKLMIVGTIESSPWWGKVDYRHDPPFVYMWDPSPFDWVPVPPNTI